jgi:hypothetical protein
MSNQKRTKINRLVGQWPRGTAAAASYLNRIGFSRDLLNRYKRSGWVQPFGRGAYKLFDDTVEWPGALYALQTQLGLKVHAGGKTALEIKGYGHYPPPELNRILLYGFRGQNLPGWFNRDTLGVEILLIRTNLFPRNFAEGLSEFRDREFSVHISSPERAAMEMLLLVPKKIGFAEASLIMENLVSLRPSVVQRLLEHCSSIKVKRLFLYMAEKHGHSWFSKLDLSEIYMGKGKRYLVREGKLDTKYNITVPRESEEVTA